MNSALNLFSCSAEKAVLGRLSSSLVSALSDESDFCFLIFLALGPELGLSEYLVQNTQAGHSWPLGPRTIPGGQSASVLGASFDVLERSTGTSMSIFGGVFFAVFVGTEAAAGDVGAKEAVVGFLIVEKLGRRMLSMENVRFLAGADGWVWVLLGFVGLRRRMSEASNMSVGVGGGEEYELDRIVLGDEGRWGEKCEEGDVEAGESHIRIRGEDAKDCLSSLLM